MQVPRLVKITLNMGVGDAKQSTPVLEAATEQLRDDHRPAAERPPGAQVDRQLQAPRGDAGRRLGDPARRPHVGVPRPPDHDRDPADPRLPRPQPALLRRPRQLLARGPRAADLPRDRLRLDRRGPRPRHRDHDHGGHRRGGLRAAARARDAVRPGGPPGRQVDTAAEEEEERRQEEARLRAEAEQAALEQLKEENPEAYAKPRAPRGGRGRRGGRAEAPSASTTRLQATRVPRSSRWRRRHRGSPAAHAEVQDPRVQPLPQAAAAPRAYYRKFGLCRICLREPRTRATCPG